MAEKTVWQRMSEGELIRKDSPDAHRITERFTICTDLLMRYNTQPMTLDERRDLLSEIVGYPVPIDSDICVNFHCDAGLNIKIGKHVFINYCCNLLDTAEIILEEGVMIGPNCQLMTAKHPFDPEERLACFAYGAPIRICHHVWLGAGTIVLPGITIGENSIIGAGSVVTKDIPPNSVAVGNPARVIKSVDI